MLTSLSIKKVFGGTAVSRAKELQLRRGHRGEGRSGDPRHPGAVGPGGD